MSYVVLAHGSTQSAAGFWRLTGASSRRGHRALTVEVPRAAADTSIDTPSCWPHSCPWI